jgi:guanylate kinase
VTRSSQAAGRQGRIFVVSGPSGAGKSSLIQRFLAKDKRSAFWVSCTTRASRGNEVDGKDYHFIDEQTFRHMIDEHQFLEWEQVHGYYYGTPSEDLREVLDKGLDVILDIDVKGALKVQEACPKALLIFVEPPSTEELFRRLSRRGEKEIGQRMKIVEEEVAKQGHFQYTIRNYNLDRAVMEFQAIIAQARGTWHGENNC